MTAGVSCSDDDDATPPQTPPNLVEAAQAVGLTTLLDAVGAVDGLDQTLLNADEITVFAPNNEAFGDALEAFNVNDLNGLVEAIGGVDNLEIVLGFHVVPDVAFSTDLAEGEQTFNTLAGQDITVTRTGSEVTVTDAEGTVRNVITADVEIENGVVHVIDGVLLPVLPEPEPTIADLAAGNDDLSSLVAALEYTDLDEVVADPDADLTVFAPTNEAFTTFLNGDELTDLPVDVVRQVLLNHVLASAQLSSELETGYTSSSATYADTDTNLSFYINVGDNVVLNGISTVRGADNQASNGVVHVVDAVITLPTVVTFATADPNFSTLAGALQAADTDFVGTLSTEGESPAPFTVFAPINSAFDAITVPDEPTLSDVLSHHVVTGSNTRSSDLNDGDVIPTLVGSNITVTLPGTGDNIADLTDGASNTGIGVIAVDVQATNGVIHAIDSVLIPF